jgi:hypothetical protein
MLARALVSSSVRTWLVAALVLAGCARDALPMPAPDLSTPDLAEGDLSAPAVATDAGGDASAMCVAPHVAVKCGSDTCTGVTPICCRTLSNRHFCVAQPGDCNQDAGTGPFDFTFYDECDDAADCASGQICCSSYNKGFNILMEARCVSAACGPPDGPPFSLQVCAKDCECRKGTCSSGLCQ